MFLRENLERSLAELGIESTSTIFDELEDAYSEPGRFYHTDQHIAQCLRHFQDLRALSDHPAEVEVGLWFHDAVYDTHKPDNEERSAGWARSFLESAGGAPGAVERIESLIISTKTHEAHDTDTEIMLDVDLAILGAPIDVFEGYDALIRREYDWVSEAEFCEGRARILKAFLERPIIYHTSLFFDRYESRARENLRKKIKELGRRG